MHRQYRSPGGYCIAYSAEPVRQKERDQPEHVRSSAGQCRSLTGSEDPCSLYPQFAISAPTISHIPLRGSCNLAIFTYQTKGIWGKVSLLEEWDGDFASDDAEVGGVSSLEELVEHALFLWREVKIRVSLC